MQRSLLLHLSLMDGVGPSAVLRIIESGFGDDINVCTVDDMMHKFGITPKVAIAIFKGLKNTTELERELELIEKHNISWTTVADDDYPAMLRHINGAPTVLYYRGAKLNDTAKNIAIVGSRLGHHYAEQVISECVPALINYNWSIISGGALGVDTMAHEHALKNKGKTVAILGAGLLHLYPWQNIGLFEEIVANGGAIVSPFALQQGVRASNFPARNRIISGMSQATIVVQAAKKSGASITAEYALQQGRTVFAVPGSIFDPLSAGCHRLLKEGATPISSVEDLLIELGDKQPPKNEKKAKKGNRNKVEVPPQQQSFVLSETAPIGEKIIYHCAQKPLSTDELLDLINIELDDLHNYLFDLQLSGKIAQNAVGLWAIN